MKSNEFTILFKILRANNNMTFTALSALTSLSPAYLRDLELGNRNPNKRVAEALIKAYNMDAREKRILYDAIGHATNTIPYDVEEYLLMNRAAVSRVIAEMERPISVIEERKNGFGSR